MGLIVENMNWILYVTGALTASMFLMALMPAKAFKDNFGSDISDPNVVMLARHWGFYVGLAGLMLIYAGAHPEIREPILWFAIAGKAAIVALIVLRLGELKGTRAPVVAIADSIMVALYLIYLVAA